jgi:hypothetical protein
MKTTFLKSTIPFAAVAIMGISGAFFTTSMQSDKAFTPKQGFIAGPQGPCSVSVSCDTRPGPICLASGVQAFGKANNCTEVLSMPQN